MKKKHMKWIYVTVILAVLISVYVFGFRNSTKTTAQAVTDINLRDHKELALHIHPTLMIEILGEVVEIPKDVGVSDAGMRVIHTHTNDGTLHVEGPYPYTFQLKDFFTIWGQKLTKKCVFDYCENSENELKFYKNDIETPLGPELALRDGDLVRVVYKKRN
jgi:hypothetical protein